MESEKINGKFVGVKENVNTFCIYKKINIKKPVTAVMKISALGLYFVKINNKRVENNYFTPGFTSYNKILQVQCYNVENYLKNGENLIEIIVNKGWYSGKFGLLGKENNFGNCTSTICSITLKNCHEIREIVTDESWLSKESYIVHSGFYEGEEIDYTRDINPLTTQIYEIDKSILKKQIGPYVKNNEKFSVKSVITTPKNELVYDFGQNIAGVVEISSDCNKEIILQFGEILDENGNFYIKNLRNATGTAKIKTGNRKHITFEFTYFGFRYVKIVTKNVESRDIVAVARYSEMEQTGFLTVKNRLVNKFIKNTLWSQRDNFVDIPTDCPQRDERFGYTGDLNVFCLTACYNYDVRNFLKKWLACLRADQRKNGKMPIVSPDVMYYSVTISMWSDCAVMLPWKLYKHYGDISFLTENYSMIKKYIRAREANCVDGMVKKGFEYGDWLALDGEEGYKYKIYGGTDLRFIGNVFYYHCLILASKIATILLKNDDGQKYKKRAEELLVKIREEYFTKTGRLAVPTITGHVLALVMGIVEDKYKNRVAYDLNENIKKHDYHVVTGFIGTPYLLFALSDNGYLKTAEKLILNRQCPGWLYQVDMGATTIWERWNSLNERGIPNSDGMTSFNHYAYGSMVEFLYRRVAGIENIGEGFNKIKIMPHPLKGLGDVSCLYKSVSGEIKSEHRFLKDEIVYEITIPNNVDCTLKLPCESEIKLSAGNYIFKRKMM